MTCRICLLEVEPSKAVNIFTEGRKQELISDLIMNFAYVEVFQHDDLPKIICDNCLKALINIYNFRDKIIKSDARLRGFSDISSDSDENEFLNDLYNYDDDDETMNDNNFNYHQPIVEISCPDTPINFVACEDEEKNRKELEDMGAKSMSYDNVQKDQENKKIKTYYCDQCPNSFKTRYNLILHTTTHTGKFPHNCDICNKGFATNWAMNVHRRIHFDERPFKCELCEKSFKSKSAQIIHRKIHLGIKRYHCRICGKQFVQMGGLRAHQYTHTTEKPLVCEFCGKHYTSKRALDRHYGVHKGDPSKPCPICGKLYAGDVNLKVHIKTVHAEERIRFPCELCDKNFSTKSVLKIHMRIHDGVKPYSCEICGKTFRQASVATLHKRVHTGETPFHCPSCDKKFSYKHHLKKHVEKDHTKKEFNAG